MDLAGQSPTLRQTVGGDLYQTTPLSVERGQIRLLLLHPGLYGAPILCSLFRTELCTAPAYEALSYTWGTFADNSGMITLDQRLFRVTRNLYDALQDLRMKSRVTVLWVDALCINQDDITERSEQVRQMTLIYQQAARVLVWLGSSVSDDLRAAVEFLQLWPDSTLVATDQGKTVHKLHRLTGTDKGILPFMTHVQLEGMLQIMKRPWFSRGWVVQEVTVAKQAVVGFGPLDSDEPAWFSWSALLETGGHFMQAALNHYEGDVVEFCLASTQLGSMKSLRDETSLRGSLRLKFQDCVRICQNFTTTDPRDKVYALLGLTESSGELGLSPDYNESPQNLFTRTTRAVCFATRSLDLLTLEMDPKLDGLPSWVKDFSSSFTPLTSSGGILTTLTDIRYSASGGSAPLPRRTGTDQPHQKYVCGMRIGVVKHVVPLNLKLMLVDDMDPTEGLHCNKITHREDIESVRHFHFHLIVENFEELYDHLSVGIFTAEERAILDNDPSLLRVQLIRNLWLILSGGRNSLGGEDPSLGDDCQFGIWKSCASDPSDSYSLGYGVTLHTILAYPHRFAQLRSYYGLQLSAFVAPYRASQGRQFFVTEAGDLGLCPKATGVGDLVTVVYGASVPFVLRAKHGGEYELIGGCYAHGFMNGEAMQVPKPSEDFVLA